MILPDEKEQEIDRAKMSRTQLPLKLAWAMTIHKCQGMSLDRVQV